MKQQTLAMVAAGKAAFTYYRKPTRRDEFLKTMELVVPWKELFNCDYRYASQGLSSGTPLASKLAALRVTTVMP